MFVSCFGNFNLLDSKGLGVANIGQVRNKLEAIHNLATSTAALDTEAQDATEAFLEVLGRDFVGRMASQSWVRDPGDCGTLLEVLSERQCVLGVSFGAQAERLDTQEQLLSGKRVEASAEIAQNLNSSADDEGNVAKRLEKLEAMVALGWLVELREALCVGSPVKLAGVNNDTSNGSSMATNPLCRRMDDDISTMVDGADKVATSAERVVNLREVLALQIQRPLLQGY